MISVGSPLSFLTYNVLAYDLTSLGSTLSLLTYKLAILPAY